MAEIESNVEQRGPVTRRLEVKVPCERVSRAIDEAYDKLRGRAKLPGFRPGKVPRKVLEQHYGESVLDDVAKELIETSCVRPGHVGSGVRVSVDPDAVEDVEDGWTSFGHDRTHETTGDGAVRARVELVGDHSHVVLDRRGHAVDGAVRIEHRQVDDHLGKYKTTPL